MELERDQIHEVIIFLQLYLIRIEWGLITKDISLNLKDIQLILKNLKVKTITILNAKKE